VEDGKRHGKEGGEAAGGRWSAGVGSE